ncbi:MAG: hypothetical protein UW46_C0009G0010 [Candidatus Yanofskybacteria bacterium GW2011_GWF1_44_227]|uniref:DUF11 domain-containing protein n=1 Tax=Candidatus Yanofskybacteria bacterium GW2011_GWE2_40_11 TaxID=1619033 RepID=A0A0G0TST0_9BACT|nr:MAG: hypothetical protein UT69_C0019G0015 [Candidatus Yanofskybacteria bacterium GW2011_GWE1_40_10]KKR40932.1 MAG: hypothetical protein UT75_C0003G0062 [Candidatus Yanofskybacteria bacterium GW2011_GWE2_40_11]KKT15395.1 MAG: hypothetical protein UV97_C0007G0005 [Candidatus Yanofskybacteria bacterium GW2011_GWF2_43_596]KKT52907.1 MAG: hypothetical protein UW46_C0009G0010 [Candidatus Yanofskybacteria bacterium GW2011_GWF1_44_227]OGN35371.1 MAG: hypothetical protein A2207_00035 [Candidatus Yano
MNEIIYTKPTPPVAPKQPELLVIKQGFMHNKIFKWLVALACALFIISLMVFWFGGSSFVESGVELSISGPTQIGLGDEMIYRVKYTNSTNTDLVDLKFSFNYPGKSIILKDGILVEDLTEKFNLDVLAKGQSGEKEFKTFLVGNRGDVKTAKMVMSYKASDLNSQFEKTATLGTTIISVPVSLTLSAPPNSTTGQVVNYILDYRNESAGDISGLKFVFDYPDGFVFQSSSPASDPGDNNSWTVANLRKGPGSRISIQGVLSGSEGESKAVAVHLMRKLGDQHINYEEASNTTVISSPLLAVDILANDSKDYVTNPDDRLRYTLKYSNNSNFNLVGLTLTAKLEGDMFDLNSVNPGGGYFDSSSNTITWNSSTVSNFANLSSRKTGTVDFSVKIKPQFSYGGTGTKNTLVKVSARLSTPNIPPGIDVEEIFSAGTLITKVSTQPAFAQLAYYNDPAFGSSGPMPPKVGETTTYTIHWQLGNPGNDVAEAKIVGTLPLGVSWKGSSSVTSGQPEPTYNKNSSEIVWDIKNIPSGVGGNLTPKYEAVFQVTIKPSAAQKGSVMDILKDIVFSGKDSFTKQAIVINAKDVDTNSMVDGRGEGVVQ